MMIPAALLSRPIAHRALHNRKAGRVENSMAAIVKNKSACVCNLKYVADV